MKNLYLILLILTAIFCSGYTAEINISYQPNVDRLESLFKSYLPLQDGVIYTKVPRGLILSIDEKYFFSKGQARIKESSLCLLNTIINILHELPNYCVVENHTENNIDNFDMTNWELSMERSANIVDYMIKCGKLPPEQLFSLGFGEFMPFKDNVSSKTGPDNRLDFVILEYEAKR